MEYAYGVNEDYLDEDDDGIMYSTKTYNSDSEDDNFSVFMPRRSKKRKSKVNDDSSDEDEFEKEMAAELNATMKKLTAPSGSSSSSNVEAQIDPPYYDKIYFDSDEDSDKEDVGDDDLPTPRKRKDNQKFLSNDELFYDPLMDDADQAWVDRNRRSYQVRTKKIRNSKGEIQPNNRLPRSDAVLNCPACFTTLCLDCQRHEIYKNQYRAMFVFNCTVDKSEALHFALKEDKKTKFKKLKQSKKVKKQIENMKTPLNPENVINEEGKEVVPSGALSESCEERGMGDTFNPVKCQFCNTKVAVQDKDEIFHFFNVLSSY